jgi:hypothetical protein
MLLCAVAERNNWTIVTNDTELIRCIEVMEHDIDLRQLGHRLLEVVRIGVGCLRQPLYIRSRAKTRGDAQLKLVEAFFLWD